ncbi:MAG: hypothetical protein AAB528_05035 [Chloroflexota bacterium]
MPNIYVTNKVYQRLKALKSAHGGTLSSGVGSILDEFADRKFDLNLTKDTGLIGAIGETIAWQYLWDRGIIAFELGGGRPSFKPRETFAQLQDRLTGEQLLFLGDTGEHVSWDFVGYSGSRACLIEVKTSRPGKTKDGLRPIGRRGMALEDLQEARRLGFTMLLVNVELTDGWEAIVTDQEIFVD